MECCRAPKLQEVEYSEDVDAPDEREPEAEFALQCDAHFDAHFAAPMNSAEDLEDGLTELPDPDSLLQAFFLSYTTQQALTGTPIPVPATPEALFQSFLDKAPQQECVLQVLAVGFGKEATSYGADGFGRACTDFWKDPATGEPTSRIHEESVKKAVVTHWDEFRAHLKQKKVGAAFVLHALALFVERPCEILFRDGRTPVKCPVHSAGWEERMSLTFDGARYQSAEEVRRADAKGRIDSFRAAKTTEEQAKATQAGGCVSLAVLGPHRTLQQMQGDGLFEAPDSEHFQDLVALGLNECALRQLRDPKSELTPSERLSCVLSCVKTGSSKVLRAEGADLILVVGVTGAGKSTTINYLSGCKLVPKSGTLDDVLVVQPRSQGGPKDQVVAMGHRQESMTFMPEIAEPIQTEAGKFLTLCDTPGYVDTRGPEINIANTVNTVQTIRRARSVRMLALMDYHSMKAAKGQLMMTMIDAISGIFGSEEAALLHVTSIQLAVTHADTKHGLPVMKEFLCRSTSKLLVECAQRLCLSGISDPGALFRTYLSDTDKAAIDRFTEPFVREIQDAMGKPEYGTAREKFQMLKQLTCLAHAKVDSVLFEASRIMRGAIKTLGQEVNTTLLNFKEEFPSGIGTERLLRHLVSAIILDECFAPDTPASDQYERSAEQVQQTETRVVEERDRQITADMNSTLHSLDRELDDILKEGAGDLFRELDIPESVEKFCLVRLAGSTLPEPPRSSLPGLGAVMLVWQDLEGEIQKRPDLYCFRKNVDGLRDLQGKARETLMDHLQSAVLRAGYDALLAEMQRSFQPVIEKHYKTIMDVLQSLEDVQHILQWVKTWFGVALPELAPRIGEVLDWGRDHMSKQLVGDLLRKLNTVLKELRRQANMHHKQLKENERQQEFHDLQLFILNHTTKLEDVATHSLQLNRKLLRMHELGASEEMIRKRVDILQKKALEYASMEKLESWFCHQEFQRVATLLCDCSKIQDNFQGRIDVPVTKLKNKFKDLFAAERHKAVQQMMKRETMECGDLEKFADLLRMVSPVKELYQEFVKPHEDGRGVPWGDEDLQLFESGCKVFLDCAAKGEYTEAARCLVKYRRLCSHLKEGHFLPVLRKHVHGLMCLGNQQRADMQRAEDAGSSIGVELLRMVNGDGEQGIRDTARGIIEEFPIFSRMNVALFNKIAGAIKFDAALSRLTDLKGDKALAPEGESRLRHCFEKVKRTYDEFMAELLRGRSEEVKRSVMDKIVRSCAALVRKIGKFHWDFSSSSTSVDVSEMLGCIFAMWSVTSSGDAYIDGDICMIVQPHDPQVLVVLHLLGLGNGCAMQNHIAQVGTGEGKSVCLGILGTFLSLLGFNVNIVCYSPFLSQRDQEKFKDLFTSLNVHPVYGDISDLCDQVLREHCNVRELLPKVLKQESEGFIGAFWSGVTSTLGITSSSSTQSVDRSILIIDEVDVFFGEGFYGRVFRPSIVLEDAECVRLVEYVWQHRGEDLTVEKVLSQKEAKAVRGIYKGLNPINGVDLLEEIVAEMLRDIKAFPLNNPTFHRFTVGRDERGKQRIGYVDEVSGVVKYTVSYGHKTAFAYALSVENKDITDLSDKAHVMGIKLVCGMLPFADLPNYFGVKLGLTGSLQSASEREMDVLKTRYQFTHFSLMPSIFPKQVVKEIPAVVVPGGTRDAEFLELIRKDINEQRQKGRASLVVFENLHRLEEFRRFLRDHPFTGIEKLFQLTGEEKDTAKKEERIAQAARSRHITLITRAFGRGSDFVCRDSALVSQGGLHVIQTFPCELKSEEVQIKGRTCRQKDPGSYRQILFVDDLAPFGVEGEDGINKYEEWKGGESTEKTWNEFIDKQREEVLLKVKFETVEQALRQSEQSFSLTKQFIEKAQGAKWSEATALLKELWAA